MQGNVEQRLLEHHKLLALGRLRTMEECSNKSDNSAGARSIHVSTMSSEWDASKAISHASSGHVSEFREEEANEEANEEPGKCPSNTLKRFLSCLIRFLFFPPIERAPILCFLPLVRRVVIT
jgi:hypothetical protein